MAKGHLHDSLPSARVNGSESGFTLALDGWRPTVCWKGGEEGSRKEGVRPEGGFHGLIVG